MNVYFLNQNQRENEVIDFELIIKMNEEMLDQQENNSMEGLINFVFLN